MRIVVDQDEDEDDNDNDDTREDEQHRRQTSLPSVNRLFTVVHLLLLSVRYRHIS
jgi:hypothetical protein